MRGDAFLTSRDLGAFTQFVDVTYHSSPFHRRAGTKPPLVSAFRISRIKGFITNLALHGQYRKENDALARSLGYKVGTWPLVPLQGIIVRDHPDMWRTHAAYVRVMSNMVTRPRLAGFHRSVQDVGGSFIAFLL